MIKRLFVPFIMVATLVGLPTSAVATTPEFPAGYEGYHTYAEVNTELDAVVANYGSGPGAIVKRYLIGQSYEGRDIWALKISDNVATDEAEPEVLSESLMHAREHITVEMNLYLIGLLTQNYGQPTPLGQRVTDIVNSREVWIIPMVNPDGGEYDISDGVFHGWRKNRQPNPGSDKIGIDLNRNFGFKWACCGGSSAKPGSARYRGQYPFEAVEAQVLRDFVLSRRVGGLQQISGILNWHSYGEFIMWPYGYTKEDVPPTMTVDDHTAFVALANQMTALNGYRGHQGSDSYIYDGDFPAWAYGDQRIFIYTFEMYPRWGCNGCGGFRPPDSVIERETTRNTDAVLHFLEMADCPYRAAGLDATHCGPFEDDFEIDRGWAFDADAPSGGFERATPALVATSAGIKQRSNVPNGEGELVSGAAAGVDSYANDVDGTTSALSPAFSLGGGSWRARFRFTFAYDALSTADDYLRVSVVDGSTTTAVWTLPGRAAERNARWRTKTLNLSAWAGRSIRLLVEARDGGTDNLVEAALDDLRVYAAP